MAQLVEKIKVKYQMYRNGVTTEGECYLSDIPEEDKKDIVSLAIFPIRTKAGEYPKNIKDLSKYIADFPILRSVAYPNQFEIINVGQIQKNGCPNLAKVIRTAEVGFEGSTNLTVKGSSSFSFDADTSNLELNGFAKVLPSGQDVVSVVEVPVKVAKTHTTTTKKHYITEQDLTDRIAILAGKLQQIEDRLGSNAQAPSVDDLKNILQGFVGKFTDEQLNTVIKAVQNINVNVETSALVGEVERVVRSQVVEISRSNNDHYDDQIERIISTLDEMKQKGSKDEELLGFFKESIPQLVSSNEEMVANIIMDLSATERVESTLGAMKDKLDNSKKATESIMLEMTNVGDKLNEICQKKGLDEQTKEDLMRIFNMYAADLQTNIKNDNNTLANEVKAILGKMVTAEDISQIVKEEVSSLETEINASNSQITDELTRIVSDRVITAMNGIENKTMDQIADIKESIANIFQDDGFKASLSKIIQDSDLSKTSDIDEIKRLIVKNHKEEMDSIAKVSAKMDNMLSEEKIKSIISSSADAYANAIMAKTGEKIDNFEKIFKSALDTLSKNFYDECKSRSMTMQDAQLFLKQFAIQSTIESAVQLSILMESKKNYQITQNIQTNQSAEMTTMLGLISGMVKSNFGIYNSAYGLSSGLLVGGGLLPVGLVPYMTAPFMYGNTAQYGLQSSFEATMAARMQLIQMMSMMGMQMPGQLNPIDDKDKVIADLKQQLAEKDKQIDDLNKKVETLIEEIKQLKSLIQQGQAGTQPVPPKKDIKPQIALPTTKKEDFIKKTTQVMDKLAEPKLTKSQKFKKWLKRHPLAFTAMGLGAGALISAGIAAVGAGGIVPLIETAKWFVPTLKTIGIGAGVGLCLGAAGEVAGRVGGLGKKDRLYGKFQKQVRKCEEYKNRMLAYDKQVENAKQAMQDAKEAMKSAKKLKQKKKYQKALQRNAKALKTLRAKSRAKSSAYKDQVEKLIDAKKDLNAYEATKGKTMAMSGNLQKLRDAKAKFADDMANAADEDEEENIKEDFDTEKEIINAYAGQDITGMSDEYKTGDAEVEAYISAVKGSKSSMQSILDDIKQRNEKTVDQNVESQSYDKQEVIAYISDVLNKGNEADLKNLEAVVDNMKKVNDQAIASAKGTSGDGQIDDLQGVQNKLHQTLQAMAKAKQAAQQQNATPNAQPATGAKSNPTSATPTNNGQSKGGPTPTP